MTITPTSPSCEKAIQTYRMCGFEHAQNSPQSSSVARQDVRNRSDNVQFSQEALDRLELLKQKQAEDVSKEAQMIKEKDRELERSLKILNLDKDASLQEIREAYLHAIQLYHPDRHAYLPPDFRQLAEMRSKQINELYSTLLKLKMGNS